MRDTHLGAVVGALAGEEAPLREAGVALGALEAADVEVLVLHAQHLAAALLLARLAEGLPCNTMRHEG